MKTLRKWLSSPLPPALRPGFNRDRARRYYKPVMGAGVVIALFELGMILVTLGRIDWDAVRPSSIVYLVLYCFLLGVTLACLGVGFAIRRRVAHRPGLLLGLVTVYAAAICAWCSMLTAYGHRTDADITVFLYTVLGVAIIIPLRPWQALAVFGGNQLIFLPLLFYFLGPGVDPYASVMNSVITSFLGILISVTLYRGSVRDFTHRATILRQNEEIGQINERLAALVHIDDLTQAKNRRYMEDALPDQLDAAREAGLPVAVMMFDLDHFKQYNDEYGHQAGDRCLVTFAGIVHRFMEEREGSFIRYGGEEFLLFLPGLDRADALRAAEAIRQALDEAAIPHAGSVRGHLTVSVGVRVSPAGEDAAVGQLISEADEALYIAKNAGRDRVKLFYTG